MSQLAVLNHDLFFVQYVNRGMDNLNTLRCESCVIGLQIMASYSGRLKMVCFVYCCIGNCLLLTELPPHVNPLIKS